MKPFYTILLVLFILFLFKPTIVSIIEKKTNSSIINESLEQEDNEEEEKIIIFFNQAKKITNKQELTINAVQIINTDSVFFKTNHTQKINTPPPRFV